MLIKKFLFFYDEKLVNHYFTLNNQKIVINMKKTIQKLLIYSLLFIAFTSALKTNAAPPIAVGLSLDYVFTNTVGTMDYDVTFDNTSFWTVDMVLTFDSNPPSLDLYIAVNKTALQRSYNYTEYHKATGNTNGIAQGFLAWIETDEMGIGENITIQGSSCKVMEQIDITIPLGIFSVYNMTHSAAGNNFYYDVTTGFLIRAHNPASGTNMILDDSSTISEFPTFMLPVFLIAIPMILKVSKSLRK